MSTQGAGQGTRRPTSVKQRFISGGLAAGMFFGVGGLIALKSVQAASTVASGAAVASPTTASASSAKASAASQVTRKSTKQSTKQQSTANAVPSTKVHATTSASKG
ncbi:MAG: hypothetical protein Q8M73_10195 [Actinomycetota bacterium]|nr:hypothetical protein [Actinomycetota bacterium]